jgi:hypothetical protein
MRLPALVLVALATSACSEESDPAATFRYPTAPHPLGLPPSSGSSSLTILLGMIIGDSGQCIDSASVRVLDGQRAGQQRMQETPCDAWAYSGGFEFDSLAAGIPMTLHASAPGYVDLDSTVTPTLGVQQYRLLKLSRATGR